MYKKSSSTMDANCIFSSFRQNRNLLGKIGANRRRIIWVVFRRSKIKKIYLFDRKKYSIILKVNRTIWFHKYLKHWIKRQVFNFLEIIFGCCMSNFTAVFIFRNCIWFRLLSDFIVFYFQRYCQSLESIIGINQLRIIVLFIHNYF